MLVGTDLGPQLQICFCSEDGDKGWFWVHRVVLPSHFRTEDDQVIEGSPASSIPKLGGRGDVQVKSSEFPRENGVICVMP